MDSTEIFYEKIREECRLVFEKKMSDYGSAWRILRLSSLTDQIFIKAQRIRSIQELEDDMLYIAQYGDLTSVRRAVKLMNENIQRTRHWTCVISPQMKKVIEEKEKQKCSNSYHATFRRGEFTVSFD